MKTKSIYLLVLLLSSFYNRVNAQEKHIIKAVELISESKYDDASRKIDQYKQDAGEDAFFCYATALLVKSRSSSQTDLEHAFQLLDKGSKSYAFIDEDAKKSVCKKASVCEGSFQELKDGILLNIWNLVKSTNDVAQYDDFIDAYPGFTYRGMSIEHRDQFAYEQIRDSQSKEKLQAYLSAYPNSKYVSNVASLLENVFYKEAIQKNTKAALDSFLSSYPGSTHASDIRLRLVDLDWQSVSGTSDLEGFMKFYVSNPSSSYARQCMDTIVDLEWNLISKSNDIVDLEAFAKKYVMYPQSELARFRIQYLQSYSIPYAMRTRKYAFYSVVDKRVNDTNQFDEIRLINNGRYLLVRGGKFGVANRRGEVIIPAINDCVAGFGDYFLVRTPGRYYTCDSQGKEIATIKNGLVSPVDEKESFLMVSDKIAGKSKSGISNVKGELLIPVKYDFIFYINGLFHATIGNVVHYYNSSGKQLVNNNYLTSGMVGPYILFTKNDKTGVIDTTGQLILDANYKSVLKGGDREFIVTNASNLKTIINTSGSDLIPPGDYYNISHVVGSIYSVQLTYQEQLLYNTQSRRYLSDDRFQTVSSINERAFYAISKGNVSIFSSNGEFKSKYSMRYVDSENEEYYEGDGDPGDYHDGGFYDGDYHDGEGEYDPFQDACGRIYNTYVSPFSFINQLQSKYTTICNGTQCLILDNSTMKVVTTFNGYAVTLNTDKYVSVNQNTNDDYTSGIYDYYGEMIIANASFNSVFSDGTIAFSPNNLSAEITLLKPGGIQFKLNKDISDVQEYNDFIKMRFRDIDVYAPKTATWYNDPLLYDINIDFNDYFVQQKKRDAYAAFSKSQYSEAVKLYEDAFLMKPTDHDISQSLSQCYLKMGSFSEAMTWINKAIEAAPKNTGYLLTRIDIHKAEGNNYSMGFDYRTLGQVTAYFNESHYANSAYCFLVGGYYNEAIASANTGISGMKQVKNENLAYLYNIRGLAYERSSRKAMAVEDYLSAVKFCPSHSTTNMGQYCYNVAVTYANMKKWTLACPYYKKACSNDSKFCNYYYQCR